ncbi:MAG: glycosyltransferase family 4 protein [Burkholderiaceae bacterium]
MSGDRLPLALGALPAGAVVGPRAGAAPMRVVHLVGDLTDSVFRLLGPATEALRQSGCDQAVLLTDDPLHPELVGSFHPDIQVVALPRSRNRLRRWQHWLRAARDMLSRRADVVHVHGVVPSVLGGALARRTAASRVLYSPHDSRLQQAGTRWQRAVSAVARPWVRRVADAAVLSLPSEARLLGGLRDVPVAVVQARVDPVYFETPRRPAPHPLIAGGVLDAPDANALRFVQMAVLMAHGENGLAFDWAGAVSDNTRSMLIGGGIGMTDGLEPAVRAARLAAAWLYLCPAASHGFPGHLAEALAGGVPVVVLDTPAHRDLVRDGVDGFLCTDERDMVLRMTELLADPQRRERMGAAARREALRRFGGDAAKVAGALLQIYDPAPLPRGIPR